MDDKEPYDVRGRQSGIFRLFCFDKEGLAHMLFYRVAIFVALLLIASMAIGVKYVGTPFINGSRVLILLLWILFTPQLFETIKAFSIIASHGTVFGRLNASFTAHAVRKGGFDTVLRVLPYLVMIVWAIGFLGVVKLWFV